MKILFNSNKVIIACILSFSLLAFTESNEKEQIKATVETMFEGMRKGDSTMVHSVFSDEVRMFSSFTTLEGEEMLRPGSLTHFLHAVGTPHDQVWDERIWDLKIEVDDNLAHAWMNYAFYAGESFSHCGVNAMQLVKMNGQWKIVHLIDTRRKTNCDIPANVKK